MSTLKVDTIKSDTTPTVTISDGLSVSGVTTSTGAKVSGQFEVTTGANSFLTSANVFKGTAGQKGVYLRSALSAAGTPSYSSVDDTNTGMFLPGSDVCAFTTGGSERVRIDDTGKVGISTGTISPDGNQLLIRAKSTFGTTKGHIMLTGDGATNGEGPQIVFSESGSGSNFAGAYVGHVRTSTNSVGDLVFGCRATGGDANTVPTERLRIRSDGKISCGTAINNTNTYELSLTGADGTGGFYAHGRNHYLSNRSNAYASLTLKKSNADSDGVDYLQIRDSGNNYLSGISGAGNWKPAAGKGIDFSSTSDAGTVDSELLDDYENGSWTPTCSYSVTLSTAFGYYTRIGHRVICDMFITVNNDQSNQTFEINNLPFTSGNGYDLSVPAVRMSSWDLPTGTLWVSGHTGAAKMSFHCNKDNANYVVLPADSGGGMIVSFTYEVA